MEKSYTNLRNCKVALKKALDLFELSLEQEITDESINVSNWAYFPNLDVQGFCSFSFFENGFAIYSIYFDKIDFTPKTCELLNKFNSKSLYFRAYINDESELTLEHSVACLRDDFVYDYTTNILTNAFGKGFSGSLKPLVDLTYIEE